MKLLLAFACVASAAGSSRSHLRQPRPIEEVKAEMKLEKAWGPAFAPRNQWKDQMHEAHRRDTSQHPFKEDPWAEEAPEKVIEITGGLDAVRLDADEAASPMAASTHRSEDTRRGHSPNSLARQRADDTKAFKQPAFDVLEAEKGEPDFFGDVFGKDPQHQRFKDVGRQMAADAGAKSGHWGEKAAPVEYVKPWEPSLLQTNVNRTHPDLMGADRGGRSDFVAPCPLESTVHPESCGTFFTGGHPAVPEPVPCPAIQTHCNAPLSLRCNGSCCPVCWAPDHVVAMDRHTTVHNEDVIPPHPAAPASCAGVKCFTPLCMPGYEVGHQPGSCCSSCRPAR